MLPLSSFPRRALDVSDSLSRPRVHAPSYLISVHSLFPHALSCIVVFLLSAGDRFPYSRRESATRTESREKKKNGLEM
jgi:hypothetical protein